MSGLGGLAKEPVLFRCPVCAVGLLLPPAEAARRRYCSRECLVTAQRAGRAVLPPGQQTDAGRQRSQANLALGPAASAQARLEGSGTLLACLFCGEVFFTQARPLPLYCSERCRQRVVALQQTYTQVRTCPVCGQEFLSPRTNAQRRRRTCSKRCAKVLWWAQRAQRTARDKDNEDDTEVPHAPPSALPVRPVGETQSPGPPSLAHGGAAPGAH